MKDAPGMPATFNHLTGINLINIGQYSWEVFPPLHFAKALIDFYLSAIVFLAEMKEFPQKLSSSNCDIAREERHPAMGFSKTNSSRYVLLLSIYQSMPSASTTLNECRHTRWPITTGKFLQDITHYLDIGTHDAEVLLNCTVKYKRFCTWDSWIENILHSDPKYKILSISRLVDVPSLHSI